MANPAATKKQIVDSIKQANSVLVTVSRDPSVDELSAALGLTIFLNKLEKHATAVFSGQMPPAITFLEPDKTFEATADSLRDFIIALDKEKADHLRYKVVEDSVKIFITPYRTTISENDLEFSQGDYNVDLVIALNVEKHDYLDTALTAHGKILHDAEVVTVTARGVKSSLGTIDWHDDEASGVSEMLVGLLNDLKGQKVSIDEQIATALLTGIVSATDRFGNEATSSRVMTAAATLMAAGANHKLIASKLEGAAQEKDGDDENSRVAHDIDGSTFLQEGASTKLFGPKQSQETKSEPANTKKDNDDSLTITHTKANDLDEVARQVEEQQQRRAAKAAKAELDKLTAKKEQKSDRVQPQIEDKEPKDIFAAMDEPSEPLQSTLSAPPDIAEDLRRTTEQMMIESQPQGGQAASPSVISPSVISPGAPSGVVPSVGGTLNATSAQAAEDKRRAFELDQNRTILKHGKPIGSRMPSLSSGAFNASMDTSDEPQSVDVFAGQMAPTPTPAYDDGLSYIEQPLPPSNLSPSPQPEVQQMPQYQPQPQNYPQQEQALAPNFAQTGMPLAPVDSRVELSQNQAPMMPEQFQQSQIPQPPLPPMPDFNNLPPLPPMPYGVDPASLPSLPSVSPNQPAPPPQDFNPSQFQIPAQ